jgi:arylsulfatase A-like enzyme
MLGGGEDERPNVLLIVLDTLRADAVEPYGAKPGSSPAIADLAKRGVAVQDVRATASWTLPSHVAMFTGVLARGLGLGQAPANTPQSAGPAVRAQQDRFLAEVLRRHGYRTAGVTTNLWVGSHTGFDTGFQRFVELDTSRQAQLGGGWRLRVMWDWEGGRGRADDGAARAREVIQQWLGEIEERPFFWFVNLVECHSPYLPPKPYGGTSTLERIRAADEASRYLTFAEVVRTCIGAKRIPDGALARMRKLYAASVRYADQWVEDVIQAIDERGLLEDTLVLVCSDHGENLGEADLIAHSLSLDDRLLRVPFIACGPSADCFSGLRSLAELPRRLATAVRLDEHPWKEPPAVDVPVAQWDPLAPATHPRVAELVVEWQLGEDEVDRLTRPLTCAVLDDFKLVVTREDDDEELYDLKRDPLELEPLRREAEMRQRAGDAALAALRSATRKPQVRGGKDLALEAESASAEEVADIERRMRLMGYM